MWRLIVFIGLEVANAQAGDGLWMIYWIFLDDSGIFLLEMYMISANRNGMGQAICLGAKCGIFQFLCFALKGFKGSFLQFCLPPFGWV